MDNTEQNKLLYKIARAYYDDQLTQEKIGRRFGLSRIKISRLLRQAREQNVIQITINAPKNEHSEVERALEDCFELDEVLIVRPEDENPATIRAALGSAAANFLMRSLRGVEVVALTWGSTLLAMVDSLRSATGAPIRDWPNVKIVQALGGLGNPGADIYSAELVHRIAAILGGKARILAAPGILASQAVCDELFSHTQVSNTLELAAHADIALMGIGQPTPDSVLMQSNILNEKEFAYLHSLGMVGDIGLRFIDANGDLIESEINNRVLGLTLEQIKEIPRVIGVAGGPEKFEVIRAALRGRLVKVLITDINIGKRLLTER